MTQPIRHPLPLRHASWLIASALCSTAALPAFAAHELFAQSEPSSALNTIEPAAAEQPAGKTKQVSPPPPVEPAPESGPAELIGGQPGASSPSFNVTINLIKRMVQKGLLTKEDAADLLKQAEADAAIARVQLQQDAVAAAQIVVQQAINSGVMSDPVPMPDDAVRVTYIPENVKKQLRDEIKTDVMAKARTENWAAPNAVPGWVTRFRVGGDIRIRYEGAYFPSGNDNGRLRLDIRYSILLKICPNPSPSNRL